MTWQKLSLSTPTPTVDLANSLISALNLVKTSLESAKTILSLLNITNINLTNSFNSIITNINNLLNNLTGGMGAYVLKIPPPKKAIINLINRADSNGDVGSNFINFPRTLLTENNNTLRNNDVLEEAFNSNSNFVGGNAYILKTIIESLFDRNDSNRPMFDTQSNWAYMLLMCGAGNLTSLLPNLNALENLIGTRNSTNTGITKNMSDIIPQNIRTRLSNRGSGVVIEWNPLQSHTLNNYDGSQIDPIEIAIIRSEHFQARSVTTVSDLFGDNNLTVNRLGRFSSKVLAIIQFDGVIKKFIDTDISDKKYIYHVAIKTRATPPADINRTYLDVESVIPSSIEIGYNLLSNASEIDLRRQQTTAKLSSVAPDWERTPSIDKLFPSLNLLSDLINEQLNAINENTTNINSLNQQLISNIENEINIISQKIIEAQVLINQINHVFGNLPENGIFLNYTSGQGNFINSIASELNNISDENRPNFTEESYTAGVLILLTGPDATLIEQSFKLLADILNPTSVENIVSQITIGATNLQQEALNNLQAELSSVSVGFNEDMSGRETGNSRCD